MIVSKTWLTPRVRNLIVFNVMIMLAFGMVVTDHSIDSYKELIKEHRAHAERRSNSLADHTELAFLTTDIMVRRAVERQYINALLKGNLSEYTSEQFASWLKEAPQILAMSYIDEHGELKGTAQRPELQEWKRFPTSPTGAQMAESMRLGNTKTIFIGSYITTDAQRVIVLSRRYERSDGSYGGFIVAAINPQFFANYFRSASTSETSYIQIRLNDTLLFSSAEIPKGFNHALLEQETLQASKGVNGSATLVTLTKVQGKLAIMASQQLRNLPIVVSVTLGEDGVFKNWRSARDKDIGFLALFVLFGTVISFFAVAMSRHITRAEQSESSAILASQAKSEFLANMSHELRTPLNAVIGYSEMLNSEYFGPLNQKQKERVHDINLCGTHLLQLINDILEFSKGEAGKLELSEEQVDIAEVINETVRIMNARARMKNIRLVASIEPDVVPLWGDRRKIAQTLLNLISNSVKFTPDNGTVRISAKMDIQHALSVTVSDTGIGIAEDDIPKALSVFGQVQRSQSHEGTGLGLPLCKMYAELHGGKLSLSSKLGAGTTVKIQFPHQRSLTKQAHSTTPSA